MSASAQTPIADDDSRWLFAADRPKAFVDAVIAIAMTLLILPLMESAAELGAESASVASWFEEQGPKITTFVISFLLISFFWIGHHRVFARVEFFNKRLIWLTIVWLLTVVWLPVATALTGHSEARERVVVLVYIGSMFAAEFVWLGTKVYLARHPELHTMSGALARRGVSDGVGMLLVFVVAGVVAGIFPQIGYFSLMLLYAAGPVRRLMRPLFATWHPFDGVAGATPGATQANS